MSEGLLNTDVLCEDDTGSPSGIAASPEQKTGTLYGVGVGPGDPELMTLKAHRLITNARSLAYFCKDGRKGHGRTIVDAYIPADCTEIRMAYPVTTEIPVSDPRYSEALTQFYDRHALDIAKILQTGEDVVAISEGDPFFYGSFMPIYHRLSGRYSIEVVPGVPAMAASWARSGAPITYGDDVLTVVPGTLAKDALRDHIDRTDALVIMKLGRHFQKVRDLLEEHGRLGDAFYVERCSMAGERICPLAEINAHKAPYFSLILLPGKGRLL